MIKSFFNSLFIFLFLITSAVSFGACFLSCDHAHFDEFSSFRYNDHDNKNDADHSEHSHTHRHSEDSPYHEHGHYHVSSSTPDDKFIQEKIVLPVPIVDISGAKLVYTLLILFSDVCLPKSLRPPIG